MQTRCTRAECRKPRVHHQHTIHSTFHGHSRRVKRMRRRLIIILSYTAVKVFPRTTSLISQPHTSHSNPLCRRDHPRSPLICKGRVMGRLLCHSIAKHLQVRLSRRINKQAHIGLPKFLSLSNILLRHNSPTEYLLNLRMSPPMSLHISRRYPHLSRPNRSNTQLRQ